MTKLIERPKSEQTYADYCGSCGRTLGGYSQSAAWKEMIDAIESGWRLRCMWGVAVAAALGIAAGALL